MSASKKKLLLIFRHGPYGNKLSRAGLDVALAAAAFEQDLHVLFMDDGVWQLLPEQSAQSIDSKNVHSTLQSMPLYDLASFHVDAGSLEQRQLLPSQLDGELVLLGDNELATFIDSHDQVLSF
jgi:tRNA 2-thiouridine synthesizing protein C